jgi:phosphatidylglycerophosphatase A
MAKTPAPPLSFLLQHPAHLIACGFGSGLARFAPGTFGTAFAWLCYAPLREAMPTESVFAVFLVLAFLLGIKCCQITGRSLGVVDHGSIVWDEIVPFWTVLFFTPVGWGWQLFAFLAFRLFDITKPPPADYFDTHVKNGFGVMMDDLMAAGYSILAIAIAKSLLDSL